jgi:hypothetical protein
VDLPGCFGVKEVLEGLLRNPEKLNKVKDNLRTFVVPAITQEAHSYERHYKSLLKRLSENSIFKEIF